MHVEVPLASCPDAGSIPAVSTKLRLKIKY
jgi:hypothetical protein